METSIASGRPARVRARGSLAVLLAVLALLAAVVPGAALAQETVDRDADEILEGAPGTVGADVPSYGAARPGPLRAERDRDEPADVDTPVVGAAPKDDDSAPVDTDTVAAEGVVPVAIQIDVMGVDAYVERAEIDETGTMQDPSGPWVVAWYEDLAAVGEGSNVVMAGHVDYWNTEGGAAVFSALKPWSPEAIGEGALIEVYGEDGEVYEYEVVSNKLYDMQNDMTPEVIRDEIVGPTDEETLTIITCGGDFNYETGEYYSRAVIRAKAV
jgi:hypothetical protein